MCTIPFVRWIANAAARLVGPHGAVTAGSPKMLAAAARASTTMPRKVKAAVEAEHGGGPTRAELIARNEALRRENNQLWDWLFQTIEFPPIKQQEFAAVALGMGLSLNQVLILLAILLGAQAATQSLDDSSLGPGRRKSRGRGSQATGSRMPTLVLVGCLDEIFFHGRPVLVGVEPQSMVWFLGKKADNRQRFNLVRGIAALELVALCDIRRGHGAQGGHRPDATTPTRDRPSSSGEGAGRLPHQTEKPSGFLNTMWQRVERYWEQAEAASRAVEKQRQQGLSVRGKTHSEHVAWEKASRAFNLYEKKEAVWKRAEQALDVFRPDGQLNDRAWAEQQVAWALPRLAGSEWSKVRRLLQTKESFTFLDRLHDQLGQLSLPEDVAGRLGAAVVAAATTAAEIEPRQQSGVMATRLGWCSRSSAKSWTRNWRESYRQVAAVLRRTVRASSAVECMNSVLRMHQSRHRTLTQELLDLKRLYWNTRVFHGGKRKGRCPYEHLGVKLPTYDFWSLLQVEMPAAFAGAKAHAKSKKRPIAT